jgi:hypothetical protein
MTDAAIRLTGAPDTGWTLRRDGKLLLQFRDGEELADILDALDDALPDIEAAETAAQEAVDEQERRHQAAERFQTLSARSL